VWYRMVNLIIPIVITCLVSPAWAMSRAEDRAVSTKKADTAALQITVSDRGVTIPAFTVDEAQNQAQKAAHRVIDIFRQLAGPLCLGAVLTGTVLLLLPPVIPLFRYTGWGMICSGIAGYAVIILAPLLLGMIKNLTMGNP